MVTYDSIEATDIDPALFIDVAGSATVRAAVHHRFGDALLYSCAVGGADWTDLGRAAGLPGAKPTLFFAPDRATKRTQEWGIGEVERRMAPVWKVFQLSATH